MTSLAVKRWQAAGSGLAAVAVLAAGLLAARAAVAAPPYEVSYRGTPVKTAVPDKPFTVDFKVTNTGTTEYSGVKVIFHIPNGMTSLGVSPANSEVIDDTVMWVNVPIAGGKTFNPSLTLKLDNGTPLKTKKNIWVQVTGDGLEETSQNFSVTAVASAAVTKTTSAAPAVTSSGSALVPRINAIHRLVYDRNPTASEHAYWLGRVNSGEKATYGALLGAMQFHKVHNIRH